MIVINEAVVHTAPVTVRRRVKWSDCDPAGVVYTGTEDETWATSLEGNALWTNSAFVQNDRAVAFPDSIWTFGGPRSAQQLLEGFVTSVGG